MPLVCDESGLREDFLRCHFIGCYNCVFEGVAADIKHWTDGGGTPLCPIAAWTFSWGLTRL